MVLTEAVRMAEGNSSPINNILSNNSVMTAAGIAGNETSRKQSTTGQHSLTSPILGVYEGSTTSSSRNKAPIYTRDKRTKFTQRENKKWVRLATVLGYLVAVCIPAIALSVYYIGFWDPRYKEQYEAHLRDKMSLKEPRQQPQQCCVACNCPSPDTNPLHSPVHSRESRHLSSIDITKKPSIPPKIFNEELGEKAAENAYYQNVIWGKNYAIYGATAEDTSAEVGIESTTRTQVAHATTVDGHVPILSETAHLKKGYGGNLNEDYQQEPHHQRTGMPPF